MVIEVDLAWYEDEDGNIIYDTEGMTEEFEYKMAEAIARHKEENEQD